MILSHKHRFIFIKGRKVAGTSAEIAISQLCGPGDVITPITPIDECYRLGTRGEPRNYAWFSWPERRFMKAIRTTPKEQLNHLRLPRARYNNHMALADVLRRVPRASDYRVIFVERSPYAKVLSLANWCRQSQKYRTGATQAQSSEGIADAVQSMIDEGEVHKVHNIALYRDPSGRIRSEPWKLPELQERLRDLFHELNETPVDLVHAKEGFGSDSLGPSTILRPEQIKYIDETFADEFESFGWPKAS